MRLTKIYTRTGDQGKTRLANGEEVSKDSLNVAAYGDIDELNSVIGYVISQNSSKIVTDILLNIQHQLFDLGGELASAGTIKDMISNDMVKTLEGHIDDLNRDLPALEEFILPGGTPQAASLHIARTICRRAERNIITLNRSESVAANIISYVNRLSDLLFVMARYENNLDGSNEVYWKNPRR